jgi:hypothetical protein
MNKEQPMQLSLKRIEARIQKLQEIKRIAADPELVTMLLEFMVPEDDRPEAGPAVTAPPVAAAPSRGDIDLVEQVLKGRDAQGNSPWTAKRA